MYYDSTAIVLPRGALS